jgi:hypothetical protein
MTSIRHALSSVYKKPTSRARMLQYEASIPTNGNNKDQYFEAILFRFPSEEAGHTFST